MPALPFIKLKFNLIRCMAIFLFILFNATLASSASCDYYLDACKTSGWETGKMYCLNKTISSTGNCMDLDASNITIDGNGFFIVGTDGYAIYNNDGYDDVAISGHGESGGGLNDGWNGKVIVYAGNPDLSEADPNISNHEEIVKIPEITFNAYPNPFNPTTTIKFSIPKTSFVTIKIYDALGIEVRTLINTEKIAGNHSVEFNASQLASGIYFYRMQAGDFIKTKKLVLLK